MALSNKQKAFISEYLTDFNATRAAERAGYKGDDATLASVGWENLRKPEIAEAVQKRLREKAMSADEVLMRLAEHARADLGQWLEDDGYVNLAQMKSDKATRIIRKVERSERSGTMANGGEWREVTAKVELHDQQAALVCLARHLGLFDKAQPGEAGEVVPISIVKMPVDEL